MNLSFDIESLKFVVNRLYYDSRRKMNDWEKGFIDNMKEIVDQDKTFSKKQVKKISDLWEKY